MSAPKFSVVLPVHNQADHISEIVREYSGMLERQPHSFELILVVNGSRDASLEVCQSLADDDPRVRVTHSLAGGWGLAVKMGVSQSEGEIIAYTNSARTTAQDLTLILMYALTNPGVVIKANRRIREGALRRIGSLLYNIECRFLFDLAYWDINGTPKAFPRSFHKLRSLSRNDDLIDLEFNIVCRIENYPMLEVPIFSIRRRGGNSTTNLNSAIRMYWGAIQLWQALRRNGE